MPSPPVSCAIVSVGAWSAGASQVYESLTADEVRALGESGVCGETCALLMDSEGRRVPGLDERRMGIDETVLRGIPTRIAIAAGKVRAILGAL